MVPEPTRGHSRCQGGRTHRVPPIWQRPTWRHEQCIFYTSWTSWTWTCHCTWVREHFNVSLSLCIYLALSLSLSLYIYNGFLPHFPFTACTCSYFCNKHTVDEVYCNEIHLICKDTSTYAKESRGKFFHPNKNPISGSESKKKGCTAQCLILPIHRHPLTWAGWTRLEAWSPLDPWQWHRW